MKVNPLLEEVKAEELEGVLMKVNPLLEEVKMNYMLTDHELSNTFFTTIHTCL